MTIYAISDLHLPARQKPMDIFGPHWENHFARIESDWQARVSEEDIVLLPGDTSWAMHLNEAREDLDRIAHLPGRKILIRGNHDYWWSSIARVRDALPEGMIALQNDAVLLDGIAFAGTRGWMIPGRDALEPEDEKIYQRERIRLELSLAHARKLGPDAPLYVLMHYPPRTEVAVGFSDVLETYHATACVYGHLHGMGLSSALSGCFGTVTYHQVSCDGLEFRLKPIQAEG